jgi:Ca2+-binding EF-hand superfamily protein
MRNSKVSLQQLRAIFEKCDINKDGHINKREFIKACREHPDLANLFELPTVIRVLDGSREQMEKRFQAMDTDNDREIRWAEFLAYYKHRVEDL